MTQYTDKVFLLRQIRSFMAEDERDLSASSSEFVVSILRIAELLAGLIDHQVDVASIRVRDSVAEA